jgi:hypothetical protein
MVRLNLPSWRRMRLPVRDWVSHKDQCRELRKWVLEDYLGRHLNSSMRSISDVDQAISAIRENHLLHPVNYIVHYGNRPHHSLLVLMIPVDQVLLPMDQLRNPLHPDRLSQLFQTILPFRLSSPDLPILHQHSCLPQGVDHGYLPMVNHLLNPIDLEIDDCLPCPTRTSPKPTVIQPGLGKHQSSL